MHRNAIYILLLTVAGLTALGMVMLFSTSAFALESHGDMYFFVKKQGMWLGIGIAAAIFAACVDYHVWGKNWWIFYAAAFVLLLLCFPQISPIGKRINGSCRWIGLGSFTFQPSELAKLAALFFLAWWFSKYEMKTRTFLHGFFLPLAIVGAIVLPITFEIDLGTSALIAGSALAVLFIAGSSLRWLLPMVAVGLGGVIYIATHINERMGRLLAFLWPDRYPDEFYQQLQGLIAFGSGGLDGLGLGLSRQKMLYLPYAHTDFIFPMVGEELGLRFTLLVVFGYLIICLAGMVIACNSCDRLGMLLGFGCVMMITLQAVVNIGVTTAMLPNKGMPLPFISSGGSNLATCLFMMGILVNIHRHGRPPTDTLWPALRQARNFCRL